MFTDDKTHTLIDFCHNESLKKLMHDLDAIFVNPFPFVSYEMDLLQTLYLKDNDYFIVPARKSKFKKDTYFRFEKLYRTKEQLEIIAGPNLLQYIYKGYDFGKVD